MLESISTQTDVATMPMITSASNTEIVCIALQSRSALLLIPRSACHEQGRVVPEVCGKLPRGLWCHYAIEVGSVGLPEEGLAVIGHIDR